MDELIKALAHDVELIESRQAKNVVGEEQTLNGMSYAFKCALGRVLLTSWGEDPTNTEKANIVGSSYLEGYTNG